MKQIYKYIVVIFLTALVVLLCVKSCSKSNTLPGRTLINTDSLVKSGYAQGYEIAKLEEIGKVKDSIQTRYVTKWKEYKAIHDTVELVKECILNCDSALNGLKDYACHLETVSAKKDTVINTWIAVHKADSTNVETFKHENDSLAKSNKKFWRGFKVGFVTGAILGTGTNLIGG